MAAAGAGAITTIAGCTGGDNGDDGTVRMMTATDTSTAYAANEGLAAVVNEYGDDDEIFVEPLPGPGTEGNIGALNSEDTEMAYIQNWSIELINEGEEPFDQIEFEPAQVFHFYQLPWFFVTPHDDIEMLSDLEEDHQMSPTPEGSGTRPALELALSFAVDDFDDTSYDYGEQGPAMDEGRLDVGVGTLMNFDIDPGWQQEMMSTVDTYVIDIDDDIVEEWEDAPGLEVESFPGEDLEYATGAPDEAYTPVFEYNFIARQDFDYDTVYSFLEGLHQNREELESYHELLGAMEDEQFFIDLLWEHTPLHAAAYDYWEDQGLDIDAYERADEP
ncbi:TAXI family TRAP transporter solute-binding subunit [Natronorubrum sediminis]|nr:TAXI family TRAP transporter solute-binding subunit [Natronorubrum sediminis]